MRFKLLILMIGAGLTAAAAGGDGAVTVTSVNLPQLPLGVVNFASGRAVNLSVSPGAGAFRHGPDAPGRIWTVTDRGPSIDCSEERDVIGADDKLICTSGRRGKIYLLPGFVPSIYAIDIGPERAARFAEMIPLKGTSGKPLTGLPNPLVHARTEEAYSTEGQVLEPDPSGIEPGGLVRLSDGTFWIAEGFGPSLLEVAGDGTVLRRIVPVGLAEDFKLADYPVVAGLPAILTRRQIGRGFEGLALSPDEAFLYVSMQNGLVSPDLDAYRTSPAVRILKIERSSGKVVDQFLYALDPQTDFQGDHGMVQRAPRQSDVRVMEIVCVGQDRLLVLERLKKQARIYRVDLSGARPIPAAFDQPATQPSLEALPRSAWSERQLEPLSKTLLFESTAARPLGGRLSGMALVSSHEIAVIGNNDFGIDGSRTQMFRLTFPSSLLN